MARIIDWYNEDEFSTPYTLTEHTDDCGEKSQFAGWHYLSNYEAIVVRYTGDKEFEWDCTNQQWSSESPR